MLFVWVIFMIVCTNLLVGVVFFEKFWKKYSALRSVANVEGCGVLYFDGQNRLVYYNDEARSIISGNCKSWRDMLILQDFLDFLYDCSYAGSHRFNVFMARVSAQLSYIQPDFQEVIQTQDGRLYLALTQKTQLGGVLLHLVDLQAWRQRDKHFYGLSQSNKQLYNAVETYTHGLVISAPKRSGHPITYVNAAFEELSAVSKHDAIEKTWDDVLQIFCDDPAKAALVHAIDTCAYTQQILEFRNSRRALRCAVKITPTHNMRGVADLLIGEFSLLQDKQDAQGAYDLRAYRSLALKEFSGSIAHDFNNILMIIEGYARLLKNEAEGDSDQMNAIERIVMALDRGKNITQRIADYCSAQVSNQDIYDLRQICAAHMLDWVSQAHDSVELVWDIGQGALPVQCSQDTIGMILDTLLQNAVEALKDGGGSVVACVEDVKHADLPGDMPPFMDAERYACISIADTGHGIDPDILPRIFDPLFSTDDNDKKRGGKLAVCYTRIGALNGTINVQSEAGKGTQFNVYLPLNTECKSMVDLDDVNAALADKAALLLDTTGSGMADLVGVLEAIGCKAGFADNEDEALDIQDQLDGAVDVLFIQVDTKVDCKKTGHFVDVFKSISPDVRVVCIAESAEMPMAFADRCLVAPVREGDVFDLLNTFFGGGGRSVKTMDHYKNEGGAVSLPDV